MSDSITLLLANRQQAWSAMERQLFPWLKQALQAERRWLLTVRPEKRSDEQSRRFHAICGDLARSGLKWGGKRRDKERWKQLLVSGHAVATGEGAEIVAGLQGEFMNLRESTAEMSTARASSLIEYATAFCVVNGVHLSDPAYACRGGSVTFARRIQEARERREAEKAANLASNATPSRSLHRATYASDIGIPTSVPKRPKAKGGRTEELIHKGKLAALGCMACRRIRGPHEPGPVELHHLREGGWGKGDYMTLMPLCVDHHRGPSGVHGMGTKAFAAHYGFTQRDLLNDALASLGLPEYQEKESQE